MHGSAHETPTSATAPSGSRARAAGRRGARALACGWLVVMGMLVMASAQGGCLITSTPQFTAEPHTAPFLDSATASPDPSHVLVIDLADSPTSYPFSADVISQDDPTGPFSQVVAFLYLDFGSEPVGDAPYYAYFPGGRLTEPGTLDQTNRRITAHWTGLGPNTPQRCYTATLVAMHNFDFATFCPCPGDYSQITWQVLVCNSAMGSCDTLDLSTCLLAPNQISSPGQDAGVIQMMNDCAIYAEALDAGTSCPANTAGASE